MPRSAHVCWSRPPRWPAPGLRSQPGRAYAASNWATDATLRAIAAEVVDPDLDAWLLDQQSTVVAMGMTSVDLREMAPQYRPVRKTR